MRSDGRFELQFRAVQKCLLSKFREARPSSVEALVAVMEETYDHLVDLSDKLTQLEGSLVAARGELSCAVQLIHLCLRCAYHMSMICTVLT